MGLFRRLAGFALGIAGFCMIALLVLFLLTAGGIWWLTGTASGQHWLSTQISAATADSGMAFRVTGIRAIGAGRIGIERLQISQDGAPYADIAHTRISPSLALLLQGRPHLGVAVGRVVLYTVPARANVPEAPATAPIPVVADLRAMAAQLPVDNLRATLKIGQLVFVDAQGKAGAPLATGIDLALDRKEDRLALSGDAWLRDAENAETRADLQAALSLDDTAPALLIDELRIRHGEYDQTVTGEIALPRDGGADEKLPLRLQTQLGAEPAFLNAALSQSTEAVALEDLKIAGPGIAADGSLRLPLQDDNASGRLDAKLEPQKLAAVLPQAAELPVKDTLDVTLSFDGAALTLGIPRLALDGADLRDISVTTAPMSDTVRSIELSARESASAAAVKLRTELHLPENGWRLESIDGAVTLGRAGAIAVTGRADMQAFDLKAATRALRLDRLQGPLAMPDVPIRLDDTSVTLTGSGATPVVALDGRVTPLALPKGAPALAVDVTGSIADGMATINAVAKSKALKEGKLSLRHPVTFTLEPFAFTLPATGLAGDMRFAGDLGAFRALLPPDLTLAGSFNAEAVLGGGIDAPTAKGTAQWRGGRMAEKSSGIALRDIEARLNFSDDHIELQSFTARDARKGRMQAQGRVTLDPASWPADISVKMTGLDPFAAEGGAKPLADGLIDADLRLKGARNDYLLQGKIGTDRLDITLPDRFGSSLPRLNIVEKKQGGGSNLPGADALNLDIALAAPKAVFVRGWGLDAEFGGTLHIAGTAAKPLVDGTLESLRGRYEEFGRRFELTRAQLQFLGEVPPSPYFDIVATIDVDGVEANVVIGGNADLPKVTFTSIPSLPPEDVLARILFGRERADISPTQALQLAQTLQRFSGRGGAGLDPLGALRSTIGLDDLSVDSSAEGGASIGAGKYIADDVYLEVDSGAAGKGGAAKVKVELTPNIKLESKVGQDSTAGGGLFWEWEY